MKSDSQILWKLYSKSMWRGIGYSFFFSTFAWISFLTLLHTPIWDSGYTLFGCLGIYFLVAVPFYFIFKNDCNGLYCLLALIATIMLAFLASPIIQFSNSLLPYKVMDFIFPHWGGWSGFVYIIPVFCIPIIAAIPIVMDTLLYLFKWIWKMLGNRKSI